MKKMTYKKNKKQRLVLCAVFVALAVMAFPMVVFGANISQEYRYDDGQPQPGIPAGFVSGGVEYRLIATSSPTREGDLPATRTYTHSVEGDIPPEDLDDWKDKEGIVIKEVNTTFERETDDTVCNITVSGLATNDVNELKQKGYFEESFTVSDVIAASGASTAELPLAEMSYEPVDNNADGLPDSYTASMVYRGKETYTDLHYYEISQTISSSSTVPGSGQWVIVATYAPVGVTETETTVTPADTGGDDSVVIPPIDMSDISDGVNGTGDVPMSSGGTSGSSGVVQDLAAGDVARVGAQSGNFFSDLVNGNIPMGNLSVTGSWSVMSLLLGLVGVVMLVLSVVSTFVKGVGRRTFGILAMVFGALTPIVWLLIDNLFNPATVFNSHTLYVLIPLALSVLFFAIRNSMPIRNYQRMSDVI